MRPFGHRRMRDEALLSHSLVAKLAETELTALAA
jgi:hypothetical protein